MGGREGNAAASALLPLPLGSFSCAYQTTEEVWYFQLSLSVLLLMAGGNFPFPKLSVGWGGECAAGSSCALSDAHGGCVAAGGKLISVL